MRCHAEAHVASPPDVAWAKLADLPALPEWMPDVVACTAPTLAVGARRVARLRKPRYGKAELVEVIDAVGDRGFGYAIEGGIGPFVTIRTAWSIVPDGAGSRVVVDSNVTLTGWMRRVPAVARWGWTRQLKVLADGFARWAGQPAGF